MCIKDLITSLRVDFQNYSTSLDLMKSRLSELTKDWAEDPEIVVNGDWQRVQDIKARFTVKDKLTGTRVKISNVLLRKNPTCITREEIIKDGK